MAGSVSWATCPPFRTKDRPGHSAHLKAEPHRQNEGRLCESLSRVRLSATPWTTARLSMEILQARMLEWAAISLCKMKDVEFIKHPLYRQAPSSHGLKVPSPAGNAPPPPPENTCRGKRNGSQGLHLDHPELRDGVKAARGQEEHLDLDRGQWSVPGYRHHSVDSRPGRLPFRWGSALAHIKELLGGRRHRWQLGGAARLSE